jgi:hypothetical protein
LTEVSFLSYIKGDFTEPLKLDILTDTTRAVFGKANPNWVDNPDTRLTPEGIAKVMHTIFILFWLLIRVLGVPLPREAGKVGLDLGT